MLLLEPAAKKAAFNARRGRISMIMQVKTLDSFTPATGNEIFQLNVDQRGHAELSRFGCNMGSFRHMLACLLFHKPRGRKVVLWSEERREQLVVRYPC